MDHQKNNSESSGSKKQNFFKSPAHLLLLIIILILLVAGGAYVSRNNESKTQTVTPTVTTKTGSLSLEASNLTVNEKGQVSVTIWEDSGSQLVNAVQANISYPTEQLEFVSIDNKDSAFEVIAQASDSGSQIIIAKGHKGSLSGRQQVAKINFKAKSLAGKAELKFITGSQLLDSTTHKDILGQTNGITITIGNS